MAGADVIVTRLRILVDMDTHGAGAEAGRVSRGVGKLTGPALAAGAAVLGLAAKAGQSASRLQQSQGAVSSVFGKSAAQIQKWADAADQSVGLSESAYGELASVVGAQLKNLGVPIDQVAGKTNDLIKMGADLSATYGGTTAEAVEALGSALRGETDPIEKYGISIKQATIEAKIGKKNLDKMTEAEKKSAKTTALLGLVTEQAGGAVGAFGREADTASGQQQRATAAWEDASAHLGTSLLPLMTKMAMVLASVAGWVDRNRAVAIALVAVIGTLAASILVLNVAMKAYTLGTQLAAVASRAAWLSALGPIALIIAAVIGIVAALVIAYKKVTWFRRAVDAVWRAIVAAAKFAWKAIGAVVGVYIKVITLYVKTWGRIISLVFRAALAVARVVWSAIAAVVRSAINNAKAIISTIAAKVRGVMETAQRIWNNIWQKLPGPVQSAINAAIAPIHLMSDAIAAVVGWVQSLIDKIRNIRWPKAPSWLGKVIPGGTSAASASAAVAAGTAGVGTRLVGMRAATAAGGGGVQIVIQGAIDPVAVAAQIKRIIRNDDLRRGIVVMGGRTAGAT